MSNTPVDMAKVSQMLDTGWKIRRLERLDHGSYVAEAVGNWKLWERAKARWLEMLVPHWPDDQAAPYRLTELDFDERGVVTTDDFTPEQALTRLAYKVHGEYLETPAEAAKGGGA